LAGTQVYDEDFNPYLAHIHGTRPLVNGVHGIGGVPAVQGSTPAPDTPATGSGGAFAGPEVITAAAAAALAGQHVLIVDKADDTRASLAAFVSQLTAKVRCVLCVVCVCVWFDGW
jgi:hypothetical protein